MAEPDPDKTFVYISHPKVDNVGGPVTRKAFDEVYADKGWTLAKAADLPEDGDSAAIAATTERSASTSTSTSQKGA